MDGNFGQGLGGLMIMGFIATAACLIFGPGLVVASLWWLLAPWLGTEWTFYGVYAWVTTVPTAIALCVCWKWWWL